MSKKCYYQVLEVEKTCSLEEIKKSYRRLASLYHPDKNPNDKNSEELFKELGEAYEVLKDSNKRAHYDRFGHSSSNSRGGFDFNSFNPFDVFSRAFGENVHFSHPFRNSQHQTNGVGEHLQMHISVTLDEIFYGTTKTLEYQALSLCKKCKGRGVEVEFEQDYKCKTCGGQGRVISVNGPFQIVQTCPECSGTGARAECKCKECSGAKRVFAIKRININVPKGLENESVITVKGEGNESKSLNDSSGDLLIVVHIEPHSVFTRTKQHLECDAFVPFHLCMLGGQIDFVKFQETISIQIPPNTQTDNILTLIGHGMPTNSDNKFGDLLIKVKPGFPKTLTEEQKTSLKLFY